jgi:hypothetical protein
MPTDLTVQWKDHKAKQALQEFWNRTAPEETAFNEPDAVAMALTLLDCYASALRKIAGNGGPDAAAASKALTYKPPAW